MVNSFCRLHTPSLLAKPSAAILTLGRMRTSKPHMLNSKLGLSLLYTLTKLLSQSRVVRDLHSGRPHQGWYSVTDVNARLGLLN